MIEDLTKLHVTDSRERPALDIPALEFATRELAREGERPQILLDHPEDTLIRGFAEKGTPRRLAPGGTVYHGDTECIHVEYEPGLGLSELEEKSKSDIFHVLDEAVDEDVYWYGRDLLVQQDSYIDPANDPQLAGLALMNGKDYSTARACVTDNPPGQETNGIIRGDGLTSPDAYNELSYFLEQETGWRIEDLLEVGDDSVSVETYLERNDLKQEAYEHARELQERVRGIEPRSCIADFRPPS